MGEVFAGRYELLEPVAEGGMGSVWTVHDRRDGQLKAAKLLRQVDAGSLLRFIREQSMRIDHEHVVTPTSWAGEDDRVLFTMPLVRGGSVATLIGDYGPLPAETVRALLDQTLQALEAVHAAGIVHRDVKPANLLLDATGSGAPRLRLTDFGIAVPMDEPRMTRASQVFGTPGYTADEQFRGADPAPAQDLYSVGMVGLEMLSGLRPPESIAGSELRASSEQDLWPLVWLLRRTIDPDPVRRPQSATEFRSALAGLKLPPLSPENRPFVFDHITPRGAVTDPAPPTPPQRRVLPPATHLEHGPTGNPDTPTTPVRRSSALVPVLLIMLGILGAIAAIWLLIAG